MHQWGKALQWRLMLGERGGAEPLRLNSGHAGSQKQMQEIT